ncbi:MAG: hypothetical protein ABWX67_10475 [Allosphingosinicella sp.]
MSFDDRVTEADWAEFRRARIADHIALGLPQAAAAAAAARAEARTRARLDWMQGRLERMTELWIRLGRYWADYAELHPEIDLVEPEGEGPPDPPEQAELEAVEAQIAAARDRDVWPRHLYFDEV